MTEQALAVVPLVTVAEVQFLPSKVAKEMRSAALPIYPSPRV